MTSSPASVIPPVINTQDCRAGTIAGASGRGIVPGNQITAKFRVITIKIHGSKESDGAVAILKFKPESSAYDDAADESVPGVIVTELELMQEGVLKAAVPVIPKLPSRLGLPD
jgi:hypothetical protein